MFFPPLRLSQVGVDGACPGSVLPQRRWMVIETTVIRSLPMMPSFFSANRGAWCVLAVRRACWFVSLLLPELRQMGLDDA